MVQELAHLQRLDSLGSVSTEYTIFLVMVALCNKTDHYIIACDLYLLFSSPNLSGRRLDVYHTSTHGVALVRI